MLSRLFFILTVLFIMPFVFQPDAFAQKTGPKIKHAYRNRDGVVDKKEMQMEKEWEHRQKTKVNTWWEKRADTNNDGEVDANELTA